ncbi:MAG: NUDIX domain-containing protein [Armatimonadetes bacterium]|nr:NUDIX domain-containing protein [Armatimonadota bacterium]
MSRFPTGKYGRQNLEFFPAPFRAPLRAFAALVFPWCDDQVLICNIQDRGWCIPSGRVEPDESSLEAAVREAREEAGAILQDVIYLGCYRITERGEVRWADVYAARVKELVEIPAEFESMGRRILPLAELPETYHLWNPLTEAVFKYSEQILKRHAAALGFLNGK